MVKTVDLGTTTCLSQNPSVRLINVAVCLETAVNRRVVLEREADGAPWGVDQWLIGFRLDFRHSQELAQNEAKKGQRHPDGRTSLP
jgi:hypothetical protein